MKDLLKKINLFASLTADELEEIQKICLKERIAKDTVIFKEGDAGDRCYIITAGEVRISKFIPNIGEEALAVLKTGDYFGEMALIGERPRTASVVADDDLSVRAFHASEFRRLLSDVPGIAVKVLWVTAERLMDAETAPTH